jgi:lipoic acid synthetase
MTQEKNIPLRKPAWLRKKIRYTDENHQVKSVLQGLSLNTVCRSARCPNLSECYNHRRATFLILGGRCTRGCRFCAVDSSCGEAGEPVDRDEPDRLVEAVRELGLRYVVITSVTRDDLPDGGADQFARCIEKLHAFDRSVRVEVLTPDFRGDRKAIDRVASCAPDVFNHNVETVPRLYHAVRPEADYGRSLSFLAYLHENHPSLFLKSGLMVGLGESREEILGVLGDLSVAGCSAVTIGQYLRPAMENTPVVEYVPQKTFADYAKAAREMGFSYVASGPFVRSSYMAHEGFEEMASGCPQTREA